MPNHVLKELDEHISECLPGRERELVDQIKSRVEPIKAANRDVFPDHAGQDLLSLCATMLAAYRVLAPELGEERAIELLRHVASGFGRRATKLGTRLLMRPRGGNTLEIVESLFRGSVPVLGGSWTAEFERDERSFEMRFTSCGFHDFMVRNDVEELTTVFCAWDRTWLDEVDPKRDGIEASRETTLGYGGGACPFRFRAVAGEAEASDGTES